jgi:hypothetical protein
MRSVKIFILFFATLVYVLPKESTALTLNCEFKKTAGTIELINLDDLAPLSQTHFIAGLNGPATYKTKTNLGTLSSSSFKNAVTRWTWSYSANVDAADGSLFGRMSYIYNPNNGRASVNVSTQGITLLGPLKGFCKEG